MVFNVLEGQGHVDEEHKITFGNRKLISSVSTFIFHQFPALFRLTLVGVRHSMGFTLSLGFRQQEAPFLNCVFRALHVAGVSVLYFLRPPPPPRQAGGLFLFPASRFGSFFLLSTRHYGTNILPDKLIALDTAWLVSFSFFSGWIPHGGMALLTGLPMLVGFYLYISWNAFLPSRLGGGNFGGKWADTWRLRCIDMDGSSEQLSPEKVRITTAVDRSSTMNPD